MTASWNRPANAAGLEGLGDNLAFFRHGCPPHGGMGIGLGRLLMRSLGAASIRSVMLLSRPPRACDPELLSKNC
ncbi:hypothetical protein NKH36_33340 [Mesorhizobium sp. M1312]|uniref:amino acid--tRNA ligase-related protein n=1 Tax=unclassified Mesorhizobium TaxID=325217 RepID=UPI0003CFDAA2|nr:amino acid--tRNA ligase-related protein [Mesorhizobium sp. L48C026A00]ESZ15252.1 hypothetical protein X737_22230 [Mesorhizobium sp. L48C026A00]